MIDDQDDLNGDFINIPEHDFMSKTWDAFVEHAKKSKYRFSHKTLSKLATKNENYLFNISAAGRMVLDGYSFTFDELMFMARWDNTIAIKMAKEGHKFSLSEIQYLGNPKDGLCSIASNMVRARNMFTFEELLEIKNKKIEDVRNLALEMVKNGHKFSIKESILLGIPVTRRWENCFSTLKFLLDKGYKFSFSDLRIMNYLPNGSGWTIAHAMASNGHKFSMDELVGMGNPSDKKGMSVAAVMAENGHKFFVEDIFNLGNPSNISGETIAAIMARKGYRFSVAEILHLGNPVTTIGNSIGHLMALAGQKLNVSEIKALGNPKNIEGETIAHSLVRGGNPLEN